MATTTGRTTVVGVFHDMDRARDAIDALKSAGFSAGDIGILTPDREDARTVARETGTEAPESAATGAVAGGILGGLAGWLVGIGALAIPGAGPFIAAGALATTLGGAAIGAGVGAIAGALVGMGIPEDEAKYYEGEVRGGRTLVTVKADGRYDEARAILRRNGAYDIEDRGTETTSAAMTGRTSAPMTSTTRTDTTMPPSTRRTAAAAGENVDRRSIPLREEELRATKEVRQTGQVEVGKDVVEREKTLDVPVTREEVFVERHPVDRRPADRPIAEGETINVPVREEHVEVEKRPVVYEEVEVGKRQVTENQRVSDTVRREELDLDRSGDVNVAGAGTTGMAWDNVSDRYRTDWESRYGKSGMRWTDAEPYRRYGYEMANDPRYRDRDWDQIEPDLRTGYGDWTRRYNYTDDESAWDRMKDQVRESWYEARGRARTR